jgi:hypothetical protein
LRIARELFHGNVSGTDGETFPTLVLVLREYCPPNGRVGVIEIVQMAGNDLGADVRIKAERFPTPTYDIAAQFAASHEAQHQY